jgi:hypothetical protein
MSTEPAFTLKLPVNIDPERLKELMNPTPRDLVFEIYMRRGFKYYFRNSQGARFALRFENEQPDLFVGKKVKVLDHTFHLAQQLQVPDASSCKISVSFNTPPESNTSTS